MPTSNGYIYLFGPNLKNGGGKIILPPQEPTVKYLQVEDSLCRKCEID